MNNLIHSRELEPYNFTLKQVVRFLNTSTATYERREREGRAPKGQKLFGRVKYYPKSEIILFAQGNWEAKQ